MFHLKNRVIHQPHLYPIDADVRRWAHRNLSWFLYTFLDLKKITFVPKKTYRLQSVPWKLLYLHFLRPFFLLPTALLPYTQDPAIISFVDPDWKNPLLSSLCPLFGISVFLDLYIHIYTFLSLYLLWVFLFHWDSYRRVVVRCTDFFVGVVDLFNWHSVMQL